MIYVHCADVLCVIGQLHPLLQQPGAKLMDDNSLISSTTQHAARIQSTPITKEIFNLTTVGADL